MSTLDNPINSPAENVSPWSTALRYGGLTALAVIVVQLITHLMGYTDPARGQEPMAMVLSLLSFVVWIAGIVMAVKAYRTAVGGYLSFGKAFQAAFFTILIAALVSLVWNILFTSVIEPDFYQNLLDGMRDAMEEQGAPDETIDMMMGYYEILFSPFIGPLAGLVSAAIGGSIVALIVGAIMKKDPPMDS